MTIEERNEFIVQNRKLIHHLLKPWRDKHNGIFDYDDLAQVAYEQMIKCANTWNPEVSKFTTYACKSIICAVRTFIMKNCSSLTVGRDAYYDDEDFGYCDIISLNQQINDDNGNGEQSDIIGVDDASFDTVELVYTVQQICNKMFRKPGKAYNTWLLRNVYGYKQKETADMLNTSQAMVCRYLLKINNKLKEVL